MNFELNQHISGFTVTKICDSPELHGKCYYLSHEKTGAELFFLNNGSENKVFSISFRTLPEDHTGVFHILEHSVLCGSDKYPVREPFVELLKSSMNTFLNAITFPDMTMYPVASRNNRDLLNLTEVYLDAVFHPAIRHNPMIFRQEGWHLEKNDEGEYEYKGVVFNEMKGALSNTDDLIEETVMSRLFPDNGYGYISGGDPAHIPELTYERFLNTYHRHYHPSNARIYIEGNAPIGELLTLIDSYLSEYDRLSDIPEFVKQQPVGSETSMEFELGKDESAENKSHLTISRLLGSWQDKSLNMAAFLIGDVLTGNNDAPLKRIVLEKKLAKDFTLTVDDSCYQSWFTFHAENITDGKEQELIDLLQQFGCELETNGLNKEDLEASLNRLAFSLKEDDDPNGINRCIRSMGSWLYGGDPLFSLENENDLHIIRKMIDDGSLNKLACSFFERNEHDCIIHIRPSHTRGDELQDEEIKKIHSVVDGWSEEETVSNEKEKEDLLAWQSTPDKAEDLAKLPMLKKEDANLDVPWTATDILDCEGIPVMFHSVTTGGIVHLKAYFRLTDFSLEELPAIGLLSGILGHLDTELHDAYTLQREIKRYTGRMGFAVQVRSPGFSDQECTPWFVAYASVLEENLSEAQKLIAEILTKTKLDRTDRIFEFVQQNEIGLRQRIVSAGHVIGVRNVLSHFSSEGAARRALEGDGAVAYIHRFASEPDKMIDEFLTVSEKFLNDTVCRERAMFSVTSDAMCDLSILAGKIPAGKKVNDTVCYLTDTPCRTGWRVPSQIGYAVRGYRLGKIGLKFDGTLLLISNILSLSYLWNRVRVKGGAYGAGIQIDPAGNIFSYSYRDPSPEKTLTADSEASLFLRSFVGGNEKLDNYIISTLNDLDPLLSAREKGGTADGFYLNGYTKEMLDRIRYDIVHATEDSILKYCECLDSFAKNGAVCVVANGQMLDKIKDLECKDL